MSRYPATYGSLDRGLGRHRVVLQPKQLRDGPMRAHQPDQVPDQLRQLVVDLGAEAQHQHHRADRGLSLGGKPNREYHRPNKADAEQAPRGGASHDVAQALADLSAFELVKYIAPPAHQRLAQPR